MPDDANVVHLEEPKQQATIKWGWGTVFYRGLVVTASSAGLMILSAFWYHSDAHNDERYVQIRDYERDRQNEKALTDERAKSLDREIASMRATLEEMRQDVKQLLRKP